MQDLFETFRREIVKAISIPCARPYADTPYVTQPEPCKRNNPSTSSTPVDSRNIIDEAIRFANQNPQETGNLSTLVDRDDAEAPKHTAHESAIGDNRVHDNTKSPLVGSPQPRSEDVEHTSPYHNNPASTGIARNTISTLDYVDAFAPFPNPTFSLGLTQEEPKKSKIDAPIPDNNGDETMVDDAAVSFTENNVPVQQNRKSKRQKVVSKALVGDYQCDRRFLTRAWEAHVNTILGADNIDFAAKFGSLSEKLEDDLSVYNTLKSCYVVR
ncbi:hypothetical protein Bca4012_098957 [Brassica carinata]